MIAIGNSLGIPVNSNSNSIPILEARGLGRRRDIDGGWLLRDIGVVVRPGDRVAVLGPSGAGKTLLLRALALLDPVDEGVVLWNGQAVRGEAVPTFRGAVLYLHQRPTVFEGTVEANLRLPFALGVHRNRRFDRDRILSLLESLGRDLSFLEKAHRDLSGGEAQIVALLRAIQLGPTILLLDEPTASLDRPTLQAIEQLIDRWFAEQPGARALVWVTHDSEQARRVADRTFHMDSGQIVPDR
jgi:putative ABC transport system ATP-binding protein